MCGIAGIVKNRDKVSDLEIKPMLSSISHRGPDDEGIYAEKNFGLGHRRLSILDLSKAGHQPMATDDKKARITFNGEIYNYIELKEELGGEPYKTGTDTEVLLRAYQKWGPKFLEKLNGIFAFAIWDEEKKTLFCARDHVGVKPFYYAFQNGVFYFASEVKALLAAGVKAKPNNKIIYDYLVRGIYHHTTETFFEGIYELPAGHFLILRDGKPEIKRYWDPKDRIWDMSGWSDQRVAEEFFNLFKNAVTIQLRSDVPVGIQLSGGLDSSSLTAMVDLISGGQKNFNLFSFVYGGFPDREVAYMRSAAKKLKWNLDLLEVYPKDMNEWTERITWFQDQPFPGLPTFGPHLIAQKCREKGIRVILGGQGGDEIGGGYEYYMGAFILDAALRKSSAAALKELSDWGKLGAYAENPQGLTEFFLNSLCSYFGEGTSADASKFTKIEVLKQEFLAGKYPEPVFDQPFDSHLSNMQYRDIFHTKLPRILHAADRSAMEFGVEHRVPFLDYRLVEFGLSLPIHQKIRDGHQRYFIRKAMEHLLPKDVVWAPKRAVPSPQREWFKDDLQKWIRSILESKSFGSRHYFDQKKVLADYDQYVGAEKTPKNSFHIWQWIHLEFWLRKFFD